MSVSSLDIFCNSLFWIMEINPDLTKINKLWANFNEINLDSNKLALG